MSDAALSASFGRERDRSLWLFLFAMALGAICLRILITNPLMNEFVEYTTEKGAIYEKIHFGTYALLGVAAIIPLFRPIRLEIWELAPFRALLFFGFWVLAIAVALVAIGRGGSAGYLIDSYVAAAAAGLVLFMLPLPMRRTAGHVMLVILMASALIGIGEVATGTRFLPYEVGELDFRPTGLMGHPLNQGLMLAAGIGFLVASRFRLSFKLLGAALLLIGAAAAGARTATIMAAIAIFACLMLTRWQNVDAARQASMKLMVLAFAAIATLPAIGLLIGAGFLDRFEGGLIDESAMARLDVYRVFEYVSWRDIIAGTDIAIIQNIIETRLDLLYIESTPVILTFQLGLPGALFFTGLVIYLFAHLLRLNGRAAAIGIAIFFIVALSNNHLSTKMATVTMIVVMLVAFMQRPVARS
ncbi:VpsF family polysaccharide biosynthesis protein [Aliihoeflea sp. 2WW]|uniref:VpsF family polysaccharide biosynthesis protein n=1 Tax=Aliihoeflea sp. 2WW TaxID=1381123 RepID=UPI00046490E3|nr:VpsF family polysaccharide biosynthesis protein [Aliihoeflea sp. 2WW]